MCAKRKKAIVDEWTPIRTLIDNQNISKKEIMDFADIDYPLFSFRFLRPNSIKDCRDVNFMFNFLMRLKELSEKSWGEIRRSRRHEYGMESIPRTSFKPSMNSVGNIMTDDVDKLHVFRADKENHAFAGLQIGKIFYVIFIEAKFGDIYDHG